MENIVKDLVEKLVAESIRRAKAEESCETLGKQLDYSTAKVLEMQEKVSELEDKLKTKTNTVIYQYDRCRELEKKIEELEAKLKEYEAPAEAEDGKV